MWPILLLGYVGKYDKEGSSNGLFSWDLVLPWDNGSLERQFNAPRDPHLPACLPACLPASDGYGDARGHP